jgi:dolichol-phosphate mannosyltransferase
MRWGLDHGYGKIVQMDADFSHDPSYLPAFLAQLDESDVVIGSRYAPGGGTENWSALRKFISRGGNTYAKTVLRLRYSDLTGGFNGWRADALGRLAFEAVRSRGYAFQVELKYRAHLAGLRISEVPIRFPDRRLGRSKMSSRIVFEAALRVLQLRRLVSDG